MTLVLHQYGPAFGLPSASPFCIKLETYLRLSGLPYTTAPVDRGRSPTGKAPYIVQDGAMMCDSGLIIDHLERTNGHRVDGKLTLAERAQSLAFQRMLEEHFYWILVYARWLDPANTAHTTGYISHVLGLRGVALKLLAPLIRRGIGKALHAHGVGRHPPETIWQMGIADVQALSHWLGTRPWCFGDQPTVLDATIFAFIAAALRTPWDFPLKTATVKHRNLVDHTERMLRRCFPECPAPD